METKLQVSNCIWGKRDNRQTAEEGWLVGLGFCLLRGWRFFLDHTSVRLPALHSGTEQRVGG